MFVFWPAASVLVLVACIVALRARRDMWPALVVLAVILGLTLGFASWWTPFGWSAIGPRLALPWGLPLVLLVLVAYGAALRPYAARMLAHGWSVVLIGAAVLAFTLPSIGTMWRPNATGRFFQQQQPPCDAPWRGGVEKWNHCQHEQMWFDRPMPLYGLRGVASPGGAVTTALIAASLLGCLVLLRGELVPAQQRPRIT
jgi:hypothetical protein